MRIDPFSVPIVPGRTVEASAANDKAVPDTLSSRVASQDPMHLPAPELVVWQTTLRQFPEVRLDVIKDVTRRLAVGEYLTPLAAEQTARAIMASPDV